jgi:hypothetical protein
MPPPSYWRELAQILRESPYLHGIMFETLHLPATVTAAVFLANLEEKTDEPNA